MKKLLVVALSVALLLSTTACGTNSELEALKQENEQLKSQLTDTEEKATEKPT
ncbi:MAG: ABC transporter substrate-binding protein, partial [Clostridiales bacterium]|nr:ABC transporter substrate-binding protein [Clostridiales bacterium]